MTFLEIVGIVAISFVGIRVVAENMRFMLFLKDRGVFDRTTRRKIDMRDEIKRYIAHFHGSDDDKPTNLSTRQDLNVTPNQQGQKITPEQLRARLATSQ
jgi:hypothetical protein